MTASLAGRTIVFDLDGTLVDTAPDLMGGIDLLLRDKGLDVVPHDLIRPLISIGSRAMMKRALSHLNHEIDEATFEDWWQQYLGIYASNIAVKSQPFEGLVPLLDRLAVRGATLAVCTNKGEGLSRKLLTSLGLIGRFAAIAGRDTFPRCQKPNPEHLRGAVRLAGGDSARAVMVGDSDVDIHAARNASIPVIAVTFGYCEHPVATFSPDAQIDHYDQFEAALARLDVV
jgi:phosphoglycolate phosphatase